MKKRDLISIGHPFSVRHHLTQSESELIPQALYAAFPGRGEVRQLRGTKMPTMRGLMTEFGAALQFFEGFGENWNALKECLSVMEEWWPAPAFLLIVTSANDVLVEESQETRWLLKTIDEVGDSFSRPIVGQGHFDRPAIPFRVVFQVPPDASGPASWLASLEALEFS